MNNKFYQYYTELPTWAKGVVGVGLIGIGFIIGRKLYKIAFPTEAEKRNREIIDNINNDIREQETKGVRPTFPDSQYNAFANTIYEGMRYAVGDDYGAVELTLKKMINDLDVAKLIKAFGLRQDYAFGIPTGEPKDLITFVNSELGDDYGGLTNYRVKRINEDWASKGITYRL